MFSLLSSLIITISGYIPPGLIVTLPFAFLSGVSFNARLLFFEEFIGTILMIGFTFSSGKWIGVDSLPLNWVAHAIGVIAADRIGGGQHVNPAVSVTMWSLGKCSYDEMLVHISGAMAGGLVAFPMFKRFSDGMDWVELGGPTYNVEGDEDGSSSAASEFFATFLLLLVIFLVNWELDFGKYHYWIKQTLTAIAIRFLIEVFPTAGPAMNPMLGTTWYVFATGAYSDDVKHYFVYWIASTIGGLAAGLGYAAYVGGTFFGKKLSVGPIQAAAVTKEKKEK